MKRIYVDDAVRIVDKESIHYDKVGILLPNTDDYMLVVALDGGSVIHQFRRDEVALAARKGTKTYMQFIQTGEINRTVPKYDKTNLLDEDYLDLIDLALDMRNIELAQHWFNEMSKIK